MEKEFVPYELALRLKSLGFDEPCFKYVYIGDTGNNFDHYLEVEPSKAKNYNEDDLCISQPTYSQAFRWFRKNHGLSAIVSQFGYSIENSFGGIEYYIDEDENPTCYEEAELACLEKLIEIVESKSE